MREKESNLLSSFEDILMNGMRSETPLCCAHDGLLKFIGPRCDIPCCIETQNIGLLS